MKFLTVFMRVAFIIFALSFAALNAGEMISIAVLEFENNSGDTTMAHLKKGIRDIITTDISQVSGISVVERAKLNEIFKELQLSESKYFDPKMSAKIGKLAGATHILTGAYFYDGKTFRIDARIVSVETGKILLAKKEQGPRDEFFDLEKNLVTAILQDIKPNLAAKELRRVNQLQTSDFETFDHYSKAVDTAEHGNLEEAVRLLNSVVDKENSFKLAKERIAVYQKDLVRKIAEHEKTISRKEMSLKQVMDHDFDLCNKIMVNPNHSAEYYLALLVSAIHYGMRSDFEKERTMLLRFWNEFHKEKNAYSIWISLRERLMQKSAFFEKKLMTTGSGSEKNCLDLTDEAESVFVLPRYINYWPFCLKFGQMYTESIQYQRKTALEEITLPHHLFTDDGISGTHKGVPLFSYRYYWNFSPSGRKIFGDKSIDLPPISDIKKMDIDTSIAEFYMKHKSFKIAKEDFKAVLSGILVTAEECSPIRGDNSLSQTEIADIIRRLNLLLPHFSGKDKLKVEKYILMLSQRIVGQGNVKQGIKISKTFFEGENLVIISSCSPPRIPAFGMNMPVDYEEEIIEGIKGLRPQIKFYIATPYNRSFPGLYPASKDNINHAVKYFKKSVYTIGGDYNKSIDQCLIDAYSIMPDKGNNHIILLVDDASSLMTANGWLAKIPYIYAINPKTVKLSIIIAKENLDLERMKNQYALPFAEYDSILKFAIFSGGDVYKENSKIVFCDRDKAIRWFKQKMSIHGTIQVNEYDKPEIVLQSSETSKFDQLLVWDKDEISIPQKFPAQTKSYKVNYLKKGSYRLINIYGIKKDKPPVLIKTQMVHVVVPSFPDKLPNIRIKQAPEKERYIIVWDSFLEKNSFDYFVILDNKKLLSFSSQKGRHSFSDSWERNSFDLPKDISCGKHSVTVWIKVNEQEFSKTVLDFVINPPNQATQYLKTEMNKSKHWSNDFEPVFKPLLEDGADPNTRNHNHDTLLLHFCCRYVYQKRQNKYQKKNKENLLLIIDYLLQKGANPNVSNRDFRSPLYYAADGGNPELVSLLLKYKADPNFFYGYILEAAIRSKKTEIISMLLNAGADPDGKVSKFQTRSLLPPSPLIRLCQFAGPKGIYIDMLEILLKSGANPNIETSYTSPLFAAAGKTVDAAFIKLLLKYNASTSFVNRDGNTLLHAVMGRKKVFSKAYANHSTEDFFIKQGIEVALVFMNKGLSILEKNKKGQTPLDINGDIQFKRLLLKEMIERFNALTYLDSHRNTLLHIAVYMNDIEAVKKLLMTGLSPDAKNLEGKSPRDFSIGRKEIRLLFDDWKKANPSK